MAEKPCSLISIMTEDSNKKWGEMFHFYLVYNAQTLSENPDVRDMSLNNRKKIWMYHISESKSLHDWCST